MTIWVLLLSPVGIVGSILLWWIFQKLYNFFTGGTDDIFQWSWKWFQMRREQKKVERAEMRLNYEEEIHKRVDRLQELKRIETDIRHELDSLHEVRELRVENENSEKKVEESK